MIRGRDRALHLADETAVISEAYSPAKVRGKDRKALALLISQNIT